MTIQSSYIVGMGGAIQSLADMFYSSKECLEDNPVMAVRVFAASQSESFIKRSATLFSEQHAVESTTYWSDAWLEGEDG